MSNVKEWAEIGGMLLSSSLIVGAIITSNALDNIKLTVDDAKAVYAKLIKDVDPSFKPPKLRYDANTEFNAYAHWEGNDNYFITIQQGALDFLKSRDELAVVIGHELAHHMLGHTEANPFLSGYGRYSVSNYRELMADRFSVWLNEKSGYDYCTGAAIWERMAKLDPEAMDMDGSHPSIRKRIDNYRLICHMPAYKDK